MHNLEGFHAMNGAMQNGYVDCVIIIFSSHHTHSFLDDSVLRTAGTFLLDNFDRFSHSTQITYQPTKIGPDQSRICGKFPSI